MATLTTPVASAFVELMPKQVANITVDSFRNTIDSYVATTALVAPVDYHLNTNVVNDTHDDAMENQVKVINPSLNQNESWIY